MKVIEEKLKNNQGQLLTFLRSKKYCKILQMLREICNPFCIPVTSYDLTCLTPYKVGPYNLNTYVNYSIINYEDKKYIAASQPVPKNINGFHKLMKYADIIISCIPNINYVSNPTTSIPVSYKGEILFFDEYYSEHRIIRFCSWKDMDVLEEDKLDFFFKYFRSLHFNYPLVHCKAGVGRTGVFIMYDILFGKKIDDLTFLDILIKLRSQRNGLVFSPKQLQFLADRFIKNI